MQNNKEKAFAGFMVRFFAYVTDMFILGILLFGFKIPALVQSFSNPGGFFVRDVFFNYTFYDVVAFIITSLYFILMTYYCGATVGKMLLRIKVVSVEDRDLKLSEVIVREIFGKYLSALIAFIGYLMIIPDEQKRSFHDRIADTRVIYVHQEGVYKRYNEMKAKEEEERRNRQMMAAQQMNQQMGQAEPYFNTGNLPQSPVTRSYNDVPVISENETTKPSEAPVVSEDDTIASD